MGNCSFELISRQFISQVKGFYGIGEKCNSVFSFLFSHIRENASLARLEFEPGECNDAVPSPPLPPLLSTPPPLTASRTREGGKSNPAWY